MPAAENNPENIIIHLPRQADETQQYEQLNPNDIETFSQQPFSDFIQEKLAKGETPVLARVTTPNGSNDFIHYFDQRKLHEKLQGTPPADFKQSNQYQDIINRLRIKNIDYFAVTTAKTALYTHSYRHILQAQTQYNQNVQSTSQSAPITMSQAERRRLLGALQQRPSYSCPTPDECITGCVLVVCAPILGCVMTPFTLLRDTCCCPCDHTENKCYPTTKEMTGATCGLYWDMCGIKCVTRRGN